jgi:hypothetical protein
VKFVHFTAPDGRDVPINPEQVVGIDDNDGLYDRRAKTVITLVSGVHAVREAKADVARKLEGS